MVRLLRRLPSMLCAGLLLGLVVSEAPAQTPENAGLRPAVQVAQVRSQLVRPPGGVGEAWLEFEVLLDARAVAGNRYADRVRVQPTLGFDVGSRDERRVVFYRAVAETVSLRPGRAVVRFYLPPEVLRRDGLRDPRFYVVDVSVAGVEVPLERAQISAGSLGSAEALAAFRARAEAEAPAQDGILVPQYLSPFAAEYPRTTPSFIRREAAP